MTVWDDLPGQAATIELLSSELSRVFPAQSPHDAHTTPNVDTAHQTRAGGLHHAWLFVGPAGSGRSRVALAFASAIVSGKPQGDEKVSRMVEARTHPDVVVLSTENVSIKMDDVRALVRTSQFAPSQSRHRVIVIEDADRMPERTSNVLLKALEEPPDGTIWVLCAPSAADLIPTIRSRVRTVRLRTPSVDEVAQLLIHRHGIDSDFARECARHAQNHIGMAHRLAVSLEARTRRQSCLDTVASLRTVGDAVRAAAKLLDMAKADSLSQNQERSVNDAQKAREAFGLEQGQSVPAALRSQLRLVEEESKRQSTRSLRDSLDRILCDIESLYRDVLLHGLDAKLPLINEGFGAKVRELSESLTRRQLLDILDSLKKTRRYLESNVPPLLAFEALLVVCRVNHGKGL